MKQTHFLSWEIKLAANVITNQPIMKQSGTLVSIRLGLISPGMLWSHGCNLSQGTLLPLSLWSCQVKALPHSLSCLPIMFCFLKSGAVFSRLPLAWASLPKTKPVLSSHPWRRKEADDKWPSYTAHLTSSLPGNNLSIPRRKDWGVSSETLTVSERLDLGQLCCAMLFN